MNSLLCYANVCLLVNLEHDGLILSLLLMHETNYRRYHTTEKLRAIRPIVLFQGLKLMISKQCVNFGQQIASRQCIHCLISRH